jgi:hypothetical protein
MPASLPYSHNAMADASTSPRTGERSARAARRVRGALHESEPTSGPSSPLRFMATPPHPDPLPASGAREQRRPVNANGQAGRRPKPNRLFTDEA